MTEQEAMERIKSILYEATTDENAVCYVTDYDENPLKIAIEALEKQIPKKLEKQGYFKVCKCGCEMSTFLMHNRANYCPNCGQAIKWE